MCLFAICILYLFGTTKQSVYPSLAFPVNACDGWCLEQGASTLLLLRPGLGSLLWVLLSPLVDSVDEAKECFVHVGVRLGRGLKEVAGKLFGQTLAILKRYLSILFEIFLVSDEDDGNIQPIFLYSQDLVSELGNRLEAGLCYNTVHNEKALSRFHVLITECLYGQNR